MCLVNNFKYMVLLEGTHRVVVVLEVDTTTVLERNTAVVAEDEVGVTLAPFHAVLSAPWPSNPACPHTCLGTEAHTQGVVTVGGADQSCAEKEG